MERTARQPASSLTTKTSCGAPHMPACRNPLTADATGTPPLVETPVASAANLLQEALAYQRDLFERSILFWDTLRRRADNMIAHERAGKPPLLDFDYEMMLDARRFESPANYALLRISRIGDACFEACVDLSKPPVVILDPRAGHGPGIGGFKRDSEVGMAMHEGHVVYFVTFFPEPCPGQTLGDVLDALRRFVEEVAKRHPGAPPILYGNCQAGWAITLLSADCKGLVGPAVLNGSPLSYWAGQPDVNPMRLAAGLIGGAWIAHLLADLGDGRFDGAWLVANFENLRPESVFEKYAKLFTDIDAERGRFLEFERWWGGFYFLSREEILAILENLFIGNKLEQGRFPICKGGCTADLRGISNPLVIFASYGDNITPPQQALGWIPAVYKDTGALEAAGQRIVYLTNPHVGHLGIFVSAKVARLEHRAILESLQEIESLAPGLYEMKIDNPLGSPDCRKPQYSVRFERRTLEDLPKSPSSDAFERVRQASEANTEFYAAFFSPLVRSFANPWSATLLEWLHPMRMSRYLFATSFTPWMRQVADMAATIEKSRTPLSPDCLFMAWERQAIEQTAETIKDARTLRDSLEEAAFTRLYGAPAAPSARPS